MRLTDHQLKNHTRLLRTGFRRKYDFEPHKRCVMLVNRR